MVYQLNPRMQGVVSDAEVFSVRQQLLFAALCGLFLVGGLGVWGMTAQLNSAVIGGGVVKVDREVKTAQHIDGGALAEIFVQAGQTVLAGDPLARLDTFEIEAQLNLRQAQFVDLSAQAARLAATREGATKITVPDGLTASYPQAAAVFAAEAALFARENTERDGQLAALQLQRQQLLHETEALKSRAASLTAELALLDGALERTRTLAERGSVPPNQMEEAELGRIRLLGEQGEISARLAGMEGQIAALDLDANRLGTSAAYEAHRTLRDITPRMTEVQQEVQLLQARIDRSIIRAPVGGVVNEVPVNTVGQLITAGQTVATIVPQDADTVIEFRVAPTDIDQIAVGQPARLRFTAFDLRTTPEIAGTVTRVGAASQTDPATGAEYFTAQAAPEDGAKLPKGAALVPGMPVEVYIKTSARTPFDYILQPIQDSFTKAMTEQ